MPPATLSTEKWESSRFDHWLNKSLHSSLHSFKQNSEIEEEEQKLASVCQCRHMLNILLSVGRKHLQHIHFTYKFHHPTKPCPI